MLGWFVIKITSARSEDVFEEFKKELNYPMMLLESLYHDEAYICIFGDSRVLKEYGITSEFMINFEDLLEMLCSCMIVETYLLPPYPDEIFTVIMRFNTYHIPTN